MSKEELDAAGALAVDEDQDELMEEMSIEERQERLKKRGALERVSLPWCRRHSVRFRPLPHAVFRRLGRIQHLG